MKASAALPAVLLSMALAAAACGGDTTEPGTPAGPPANVDATAGPGYVTVYWTPVPGAKFYNIYWSDLPGVSMATGTQISRVTPPYTLNGLSDQATYYFVVTSLAGGHESEASNEASASNRLRFLVAGLPGGTVGSEFSTISRGPLHMCAHLTGPCMPCDDFLGCQHLPLCSTYTGSSWCRKEPFTLRDFELPAIGGRPPYQWHSSPLPPGLAIDALSGRVTGTPTMAGSYAVSVTVSDAATPVNTAALDFVVDIAAGP